MAYIKTAGVGGLPCQRGQSGNPGGRRVGCRNKTTIAAAAFLAGESEALTRKTVELALAGGMITPGEAATIAVVDTFVRAAPGRVGPSTHRGDFAADSLQMARRAIIDSIGDCGRPTGPRGIEDAPKSGCSPPRSTREILARISHSEVIFVLGSGEGTGEGMRKVAVVG